MLSEHYVNVTVEDNGITFSTSRHVSHRKTQTGTHTTAEDWKELIVLAGTWIAYQEGWLNK